ncbi:uncharacterized protein DUF4190 [Roseimicrobium gellanilyticum]|uniref:Uncharacterized protein DUF4190 n=1 Tax=Roseimicrobium gellanilyticum TaxID=748857 RepID=A0A366HSH6_9BACT|nr:DUF4190 domain-containing protein [Roseimicrobium gellanilyticum]RBP47222.1 uncharacterized protein DUF4190 [Roseimicrobium gellanilyticum]
MQYHVGRDGQQFGQFTEEEIRQGLEGGRFLPSDLVWRDGMPQWKPLIEVFGFAAAAALSAPMVSSHPAGVPVTGGYPQPPNYQNVGVGIMPMSGMCVASMVLGIISLISFLGCPVAVILGVPGVICGHMGLAEIRRSGNNMQGRGMGIAGLIMNYLAIALGVAVTLFVVVVIGIGATSAAAGGAVPSPP